MRDSLTIGFCDRRVVVDNHVLGTLAWLRETISPGFVVLPGARDNPPDDALSLTIDDVEHPFAQLNEPVGSMPCFALDNEVVRLPAMRGGSLLLVDDEFFRARYTVGPDGVRVGPFGSAHHLRGASLRLIREAMLSRLDWSGRVQLHASALAASGQVVLFAGPREAGKTSLLAHVSASTGASLVSNDRVVLSSSASGWEAHGVPTIVTVRPGTIARLPRLFGPVSVPGGDHPVMFTREELRRMPLVPLGAASAPLMLSLAQLADVVHSPLDSGGALASLALVEIDNDVDTFRIRRLPQADAAHRIGAVRFGVSTEPRETTVFERLVGGRPETIAPITPAKLLTQLTAEVACVEVTIGSGLLASEAAGRQLLHELLDVC